MPNIGEFTFGTKGKTKQLGTTSKLQDELLALINQGLAQNEGPLKDLFGQFNMEEFEKGVSQPALKNFEENILPTLTEKYIGNNAIRSSSFQKAKLKAGTDLQSQLAQLLYQAQQGQKQNRLSGLNTAVGKQSVENIYKPGTQGALHGFIQGAGEGLGKAAGAAIAG